MMMINYKVLDGAVPETFKPALISSWHPNLFRQAATILAQISKPGGIRDPNLIQNNVLYRPGLSDVLNWVSWYHREQTTCGWLWHQYKLQTES